MTETCESCGQTIPTPAAVVVARLRKAREGQGITLADAAVLVGVNRMRLWRWEKGTVVPDLDQVIAWAHALGVNLTLKEEQ